jgi:hypothetical protein
MKTHLRLVAFTFLLGFAAVFRLAAHDHIEVGLAPLNPAQLALSGPSTQLALYVPLGEPFSAYLPQFPGQAYADELSFSAEGNVLDFAVGSLARIELLAVTGPSGAQFSFWEVAAIRPTCTRTSGWSATATDRPSFAVYEDATGYGHRHGRAFSMDRPGTYQITFRAVDDALVPRAPSVPLTVTFHALLTPPLSLQLVAQNARLRFTSRSGLSYDLQVSLDLRTWTTIDFADGTGGALEFSDALAGRPRVFYRLVEYH